MTKKELIRKVAEKQNATIDFTTDIVNETIDVIIATLKSGNKVVLGELGNIKPVERAKRYYTDFETGKKKSIPKCTGIKFTPSTKLKKKMKRVKIK